MLGTRGRGKWYSALGLKVNQQLLVSSLRKEVLEAVLLS